MKYEAPVLSRFGTLRDLTQQDIRSKTSIGDDLVPAVGLDCDREAPSGDVLACRS